MSSTYHLVCDKCKVHLWIGQGTRKIDGQVFYMYKDSEVDFHPTAIFLGNHLDHPLRCLEMNYVPGFDDGYRELSDNTREQGPEPLDAEDLESLKNDPSLAHPLDRITLKS